MRKIIVIVLFFIASDYIVFGNALRSFFNEEEWRISGLEKLNEEEIQALESIIEVKGVFDQKEIHFKRELIGVWIEDGPYETRLIFHENNSWELIIDAVEGEAIHEKGNYLIASDHGIFMRRVDWVQRDSSEPIPECFYMRYENGSIFTDQGDYKVYFKKKKVRANENGEKDCDKP